MKGRRITSLDRLMRYAQKKTWHEDGRLTGPSIWVDVWGRSCSLAFFTSMRFYTVAQFVERGIYEYKPKRKR